jgi:hypothetical protein
VHSNKRLLHELVERVPEEKLPSLIKLAEIAINSSQSTPGVGTPSTMHELVNDTIRRAVNRMGLCLEDTNNGGQSASISNHIEVNKHWVTAGVRYELSVFPFHNEEIITLDTLDQLTDPRRLRYRTRVVSANGEGHTELELPLDSTAP